MKRALVVDDEAMTRHMLSELLSRFCSCTLAENGAEAWELFLQAHRQGQPFDLLCIDIFMPVMGGLELLRKIRGHEDSIKASYATTFVISTSDATTDVIDSFFEGGCDDYIAKPFSSEILQAKLKHFGLLDH